MNKAYVIADIIMKFMIIDCEPRNDLTNEVNHP